VPRILIATGNRGKLEEFSCLLGDVFSSYLCLRDLNLPGPEETAPDYLGNALIKARSACDRASCLCLADDSGLEVEGMGWGPGPLSDRYGPDAPSRIKKLLGELADRGRSGSIARFVCVIALAHPAFGEKTFEGRIEGRITETLKGTRGFGYDPVFFIPAEGMTMAELPTGRKNQISHRAQAAHQALTWLHAHPDWLNT